MNRGEESDEYRYSDGDEDEYYEEEDEREKEMRLNSEWVLSHPFPKREFVIENILKNKLFKNIYDEELHAYTKDVYENGFQYNDDTCVNVGYKILKKYGHDGLLASYAVLTEKMPHICSILDVMWDHDYLERFKTNT